MVKRWYLNQMKERNYRAVLNYEDIGKNKYIDIELIKHINSI